MAAQLLPIHLHAFSSSYSPFLISSFPPFMCFQHLSPIWPNSSCCYKPQLSMNPCVPLSHHSSPPCLDHHAASLCYQLPAAGGIITYTHCLSISKTRPLLTALEISFCLLDTPQVGPKSIPRSQLYNLIHTCPKRFSLVQEVSSYVSILFSSFFQLFCTFLHFFALDSFFRIDYEKKKWE